MNKEPEHDHQVGKQCKSCGHPHGTHGLLAEIDLDDPGADSPDCSVEDCACREYRE